MVQNAGYAWCLLCLLQKSFPGILAPLLKLFRKISLIKETQEIIHTVIIRALRSLLVFAKASVFPDFTHAMLALEKIENTWIT